MHTYSSVNLTKELALGRTVSSTSNHCIQLGGVLLDNHCNLLLFLLKGVILSKVLGKLSLESLKNFTSICGSCMHLHELVLDGELLKLCDAVIHDFLFALTNDVKLC